MNLTHFKENKQVIFKLFIVFLAAFFILQLVAAPGAEASLADSEEFMGYMEDIAEDIEEIHEDMHKVAYSLKLISYSTIAIACLLLLGVIFLFMFYRKDS